MRHQAVMGVVAVACVAVVSAPMLGGVRTGGHHRADKAAVHRLHLAGIDFTDDPVVETVAEAVSAGQAGLDAGALVLPGAPPPPDSPNDTVFSPFVALNPPSVGPGSAGLQKLASLQQPPEPPPTEPPPLEARATSGGLGGSAEVTPEPPAPPPEPPPPEVVPDTPPPPVVVVTPVVLVETPPPPAPPPPAPPPPAPSVQPVVLAAAVETAVPEPATWAMMILGFGAAGAMVRRRRDPRRLAAG